MLGDLVEITLQSIRQFGDPGARGIVDFHFRQLLLQFVDQLDRQRGEIVDEIERVLDFVGDTGGQLAERSKLLGLHQAILRGTQFFQRLAEIVGTLAQFVKQPRVLDGDDRLRGEIFHQCNLLFRKWPHIPTVKRHYPDQLGVLHHRNGAHRPDAGLVDAGDHPRIAVAIGRLGRQIVDQDGTASGDGAPERDVRPRLEQLTSPPFLLGGRGQMSLARSCSVAVAFAQVHCTVIRLAEPVGAGQDNVENRFQLAPRTGN